MIYQIQSISRASVPQEMRAVVTGASRGIGRTIAQRLADMGYSVACVGRDLVTLQNVAEQLPTWYHHHTAHACDVSQPDQVKRCVQDITNNGKLPVDVLINAAGIVQNGLLVRANDASIETTVATNLLGPMYMCREVSKVMLRDRRSNGVGRRRGRADVVEEEEEKEEEENTVEELLEDTRGNGKHGRAIINIGSIVGGSGNIGQCIYSASKSGLVGLTKSLAKELGGRNVRVNLIEPGFIQTEMTENMSEDARTKIEQKIMLGKFGTTQDVAGVVSFLVSKNGRYITGQTLRVDGGLSL